jgi:plastocyanin
MQHGYTKLLSLALVGALALTAWSAARADGWGTIKGQVVFDAKEAPKRPAINPDKDKAACTKEGQLLDDKLVVNSKNKGVRWCVVYLMSVDGFNKDIPIHADLQKIKTKTVEIDQPCCQFVPHVLAMRQGQTLVVKNSAAVAHNVNITGGGPWSGINQIVPPGGKFQVEDIPARYIPYFVKCDIHSWMTGRIAVFKNPYFAVTDEDGNFEIKNAPAGEFRLVISHETGWVLGDEKPTKNGKKITIQDKETTDLGKIAMKPEKKD